MYVRNGFFSISLVLYLISYIFLWFAVRALVSIELEAISDQTLPDTTPNHQDTTKMSGINKRKSTSQGEAEEASNVVSHLTKVALTLIYNPNLQP